jgi:hypothetical protein
MAEAKGMMISRSEGQRHPKTTIPAARKRSSHHEIVIEEPAAAGCCIGKARGSSAFAGRWRGAVRISARRNYA